MKKAFYLRKELAEAWQDQDVFSLLKTLPGEVFRDKEGRRTLRFERAGQSYFLKYHAGVGWGEITKNLLQFRMPIISARNEWQAVKRLHELGIGTMTLAGYGERGLNPARRESFVITDELTGTMSLEFVGQQWQQRKPSFRSKQILIRKLAEMSRKMHQAGINHRDYYLCHVLLTEDFAEHNQISEYTELFLIDLHRTQIRRRVPTRWLVKDLGSLYFSAHEVKLSQRDKFRFIQHYSGLTLRQALNAQDDFWRKVEARAQRLLQEWHRHNPS